MPKLPAKSTNNSSTATPKNDAAQTPPAKAGEIVRLGKDEMNLVEHPFGVLWQKEPGDSVIHYEWEQVHPVSGKNLRASWTMTGDSDHGLPMPSDERVYLVLMELTHEAKFKKRTINFSRYDLIRRLGWPDNPQCYGMLEAALRRLVGVTIFAKNAFWNPRSKSYINTGFHVLEAFGLEAEPPGRKCQASDLPVSFFTWSEMLFTSFESGYIRSLDVQFALSLQGDIALRLYRYLDKKSYGGRAWFEIDLFNLCVGHLGMKTTLYPSKLKERLKNAHDELTARGFLKSVAYEKTRFGERKSEKVRYYFARRDTAALPESAADVAQPQISAPQGTLLFNGPGEDIAAPNPAPSASKADASKAESKTPTQPETEAPPEFTLEQSALLTRMQALKVSSDIARELLENYPAGAIEQQLDALPDRKPRSKAATFVKAVRGEWALPEEYQTRLEAQERAKNRRLGLDQQEAENARLRALEAVKTASLEAESARLDAMWEKLDPLTRQRIEADTLGKLGVLGSLGRGHAAKTAFRRSALRELLAQGQAEIA